MVPRAPSVLGDYRPLAWNDESDQMQAKTAERREYGATDADEAHVSTFHIFKLALAGQCP